MRALPLARTLGAALLLPLAAPLALAQGSSAPPRGGAAVDALVNEVNVRRELSALADDSMQGRRTGTAGAMRAARWIAARMKEIGLEPAGDSGYFQRVPVGELPAAPNGSSETRLELLDGSRPDSGARRLPAVNVVGIVRGTDPVLRDSVVLVDAHYDHLGIGVPVRGDSIYNGADDDASGTVAVLEIARALKNGVSPRRTVVFLATTGEEVGLLGTRWYIEHPVRPLARMEANLEIEMIGRPDTAAGGAGRAWLTGFDRSTMGAMFRDAGLPIVPDPRPAQQFYRRSDNIAFAMRGIPAHTLSSFDLHDDYHQPSDETSRVDFDHVARVIDVAARAVRLLADGAAPQWSGSREGR
ncbi:MAG TPA: M20/M25/M40 family metallo-hydrolase [Gemmatimonadaceae bacterium]|nr:M20/M25/M40 family metallo-hydrolase [Gemmatimonadaceae bacterium]